METTYKCKSQEGVIAVDSADIKVFNLFSDNAIDFTKIPNANIQNAIHNLREKVGADGVKEEITLSDSRIVFAYYQILLKYPQAIKNEIGIVEWFVCHRYFTEFYDKNFVNIDNLIIYLGYMVGTFCEGEGSEDEIQGIIESRNTLMPFNYTGELPQFVIDSINGSADEVVTNIDDSPTETSSDLLDAIEGLKVMLGFSKGKEKKNLKDAIEGLEVMLEFGDSTEEGSELDVLSEIRKAINDKTTWQLYNEYEDNNYHSENTLLFASTVGNKFDIEAATKIWNSHLASEDGISQEDYKNRMDIDKRLFPLFVANAEKNEGLKLQSENKNNGKIKVKEITIHWAEGDTSKYDFPKTVTSWKAANDAIMPVYEDSKEFGEGYNKTKFSVIWEDGEDYDGRLDVSEKEDNPTTTSNVVGKHIKDYLDYLISDRNTQKTDKSTKDITEFLEKYDLGLDTMAKGGNVTSRIDKMVESWNEQGKAWSNISNNDSEFFKKIGIPFSEVGTSSDTGTDIMYYDTEKYAMYGKPKMANGGSVVEGVDLFEDYENIPANLQEVLDEYEEAFVDGNYDTLSEALAAVEKIGYTFDYYLDGQAYDLRKIGQKGKADAWIENDNKKRTEAFANGGVVGLDSEIAIRKKVNDFLTPLGYSAKVEDIGNGDIHIEPSTRKVGNNRSDFFDGMQITRWKDGVYEVSEYQAGVNENELYIYKETNSLIIALKDLIKGNKRKPIKKYANGGEVSPEQLNIFNK